MKLETFRRGSLQVVGGDVGELFQLGVGPLEVDGLGVETLAGLLGEGELADETPAHEVDLRAEAPQVRGTRRGDGVVEITGGDGPGVRPELFQRCRDSPAQPLEDEDRQKGDHSGDREEQPVPQGHRGHQVFPRLGPRGPQLLLLGEHGRAHGVEGGLALRGAFRDQWGGRAGRRGGDRPGDPLLPRLHRALDGIQVFEAGPVTAQQLPQPCGVLLLLGDPLAVRLEEVGGAGEAVAADSGLLVEQGGFESEGDRQRGGAGVHEILAQRGRTSQHPRSGHPEQDQYRRGGRHSRAQPAPGRPRGELPCARKFRIAGHAVNPSMKSRPGRSAARTL